jgi:stress response protein YsnF
MAGPNISEDTHEVTLNEERLVVGKETIPRERVRLEKETVTEERPVEADLRKEHIEAEGDGMRRDGRKA